MTPFGEAMRRFREERGLSQNGLAREIGASSSTMSMLESGARHPARAMVQRIAGALRLDAVQTDELLAATRHLPIAYERVGPADPELKLLVSVLADQSIPVERRVELRQIIRSAAILCGAARPGLAEGGGAE